VTALEALFGTERPAAVVTGAGAPRVGNVVARTMAQRGYRVAMHARRSVAQAEQTAEEIRREGGDALAVVADLCDETAARGMIDRAHDHFGRLDVLVNCAAIWEPGPLEDVTADEVRRHLEANTVATFVCCQHAGLIMTRQPTGGAIVNLGDWAVQRPYLDFAAYFPSKGAIPALTRSMAVELAQRNPNVRVNAVMPGPVMLPPELPGAEREAAIAATLVRREGSPANVAAAILSLVENDFITGVCLPVDGGRSVFAGETSWRL